MLPSRPTPTPQQLAPRVPWQVLLRQFDWQPGEHIGIVGTTGSGKTELLKQLLLIRPYNVVFATKPKDDTMTQLIEEWDFKKIEKWDPTLSVDKYPDRVLWPDASQIDSAKDQAIVFADAFRSIYTQGSWNVFVDESWYMTNMLGLGEQLKVYLLQARSLDISLIQATQRPMSIPVETFDQSTWLFFFRENDQRNLERVSGIAWRDSRAVRELIANLERFQFLMINTRTGQMWRSRVPSSLI